MVNGGGFIIVNSKFISSDGCVFKESDIQIEPLSKNDIVMVMSDLPNGKALAKCMVIDEDGKYTLNQRIGAFRVLDDSRFYTKFIYYILNRNRQLLRYDNGVDQTNLRKDDILNIELCIPRIEKQKEVAHAIDAFYSACYDLEFGLPAEIKARHEQYVYYRDKLLTFKEKTT